VAGGVSTAPVCLGGSRDVAVSVIFILAVLITAKMNE
jgi:hypothetical protein